VAGVSNLIQPNSRVDILVNIRDEKRDGRVVSKLFMENMRVLSVGTATDRDAEGKPIQAPSATLEVTPQEAERLAIASTQGSIQLVLRGYGDPDSVRTKGANTGDILAQLGSAPERVVETPKPRRPAPRPAAPAPVVQAPPEKPDSFRVQIFRGGDRQQQTFEKPKTAPQN
jgi:pilus assembly protein CpaB